jgi:hypothetical protein
MTVEKRNGENRGVIRREELVVERNRNEGKACYAKLLMQVDTNRA